MRYYDKNVLKYIDPAIILSPSFDEWFKITKDILLNDEFQKRKYFMHHHNLTVWDHSILVSFKAFKIARAIGADKRVCAIAGLLHDFYTQAWLYSDELAQIEDGKYLQEIGVRKPLFKTHGFTHGADAAENYVKFFPELEDDRITDSIKKHMFPMTIVPPKYIEGYILTSVDKLNSLKELPSVPEMGKKAGKFAKKIFISE